MENCPKCGTPKTNNIECKRCGIIYQKYLALQQKKAKEQEAETTHKESPQQQMPPPSPPQKKKISLVKIIGGGFIAVCLVMALMADLQTQDKKKNPDKYPRSERINMAFSGWDGSHLALTKVIKKAMNDPDSYEHEETTYKDMGDYILVKTTFRGKNAFGAVVKNYILAKCSISGDVLEIVEQGP